MIYIYIYYELSWSVMEYDFFLSSEQNFLHHEPWWVNRKRMNWILEFNIYTCRCTSSILFMTTLTMLSDCNIQSHAFRPRIPILLCWKEKKFKTISDVVYPVVRRPTSPKVHYFECPIVRGRLCHAPRPHPPPLPDFFVLNLKKIRGRQLLSSYESILITIYSIPTQIKFRGGYINFTLSVRQSIGL